MSGYEGHAYTSPMRIVRGPRLLAAACLAALATPTAGSSAPHPATLVLAQRVDHIDVVAREPMVAEHPNGTLFVAGYGEPHPTLWKSVDRGAS